MAKPTSNQSSVQIKVNATTVVGSTYTQIVGVTVTDMEVTLEFIYVNPQIKTEGQTVARVTLPRPAAEGLSKLITDTIQKHESSKKQT